MQKITVAAVSVRNLIGQAGLSIENMKKWVVLVREKGTELILFPELNVNGYIPAPVAHTVAETVPGPSTEKIIELASQHHVTICFGMIGTGRQKEPREFPAKELKPELYQFHE